MKLIFFRKITLGILSGLILCGVLLLLFALILTKQDDPQKKLEFFSFLALALSAVTAGKLSTVGLESKLIQALATAAAFSLLMLMLSVVFSDFTPSAFLKLLITAALTFTGAMIGKKSRTGVSSGKRRKAVIKRYAR